MSGPKRNPDKLNTIGVVVVGICGAVLVYVTILALQAFYMNNTSSIQTMADYGGQDLTAKGRKADEMRNITEAGKNAGGADQAPTFRIPIDHAMQLVVADAKKDPSHLIPALPPSTKASIEPVFGRPKAAGSEPAGDAAPAGAAPADAAPAGAAPAGAAPAGAAPAGAGTSPSSAAPAGKAGAAAASAPQTSTGAAGQPQPVAGAGGVPAGKTQQGGVATGGQPAAGATPKAPAQPKAPAEPKK